MRVYFHGAAGEVTGSMHIVETNNHRLLLDCGMHQGHRAEANERNARLPFEATQISHTVLSHAHIDHSGSLPVLVKSGYTGDIVCTSATRDLATLMLRDVGKIQEQDAGYWNKHHAHNGLDRIEPIYTIADAEQAMRHFSTHEYERPFTLRSDGSTVANITFYDAGHILGAEVTVLELVEGGRPIRLAFTGDLGRPGALILCDPHSALPVDYLITEATYGDRLHPPMTEAEEHLASVVRDTVKRGGKIVIPSFAVERTQELVYLLNIQTREGKIPLLPIYVDSPLAIDATEVYRVHPECFDQDIKSFIVEHHDPWGFGRLTYTHSVDDSKKINSVEGSAIIISANGMIEAGRILHHVKNTITDPRNTLLFVSYQADGTLGRRLMDGAKVAKIFGEEFPVRAHVEKAEGFSGHADRDQLLNWIRPIASKLKGVFVVHSEPDVASAFTDSLRALGIARVVAPQRGESFDLN